jgi:hypothetical protein
MCRTYNYLSICMPAAVQAAVLQVTLFTAWELLLVHVILFTGLPQWFCLLRPNLFCNISVSSGLQEFSANQVLSALCGYSSATKYV